MRELPLYDISWLYENTDAHLSTHYWGKSYRCYVTIRSPYFCKLQTCQGELFNNKKVVLNNKTNELFKYDPIIDKNKLLNNLFKSGLLNNNDLQTCKNAFAVQLNLALEENYISETDFDRDHIIRTILNKFYKDHNMDISKLSYSSVTAFNRYTRSFLKKITKEIKTQETNIHTLITESIKNDEFTFYDVVQNSNGEITSKFSDIINKRLEEKIDNIWVKYLLLREDAKFSGNHNVKFFRYTGNEKKNTFDIMEIQINMMGINHKENLDFIKNNADKVNTVLHDIVNCHSRSKKYANYLKLYSLILTRENTLVARFCFKDGLEELCK